MATPKRQYTRTDRTNNPKRVYVKKICEHPGCGQEFNALLEHSKYCKKHRYRQSSSYQLSLKNKVRKTKEQVYSQQKEYREQNKKTLNEKARQRYREKAGIKKHSCVCNYCKEKFNSVDPDRKYCRRHRRMESIAYKLEIHICERCGEPFKSSREDAKYCQKHKYLGRDRRTKKKKPDLISVKPVPVAPITSLPVFTAAKQAEETKPREIVSPAAIFKVVVNPKTVYTFDNEGRYLRFLERMGMKKPGS